MTDNLILIRKNDTEKYVYIPELKASNKPLYLTINPDNSITWEGFPIVDNSVYYDKNRIGIGRLPLHNYIVDIAIPHNNIATGLHIGDGNYGFSLGNGTSNGFIPMIIGMGSDEYDQGLYFLARSGNKEASDSPLIVFDARTRDDIPIDNRPLLGIGTYLSGYHLLVNNNGNIHTKHQIIDKSLRHKGENYSINIDNLNNFYLHKDNSTLYYRKKDIEQLDENIIKDDGIDIYQLVYSLLNIVQQQNKKIKNLELLIKRDRD